MHNCQFYFIFHGNLAFSAIEEEQLPEVIDRCYLPLLDWIEATKTPVGLELSGFSLEKITEHRPRWIEKATSLMSQRLLEIVASGYMQCIGPIMPYKANAKNQELGLDTYNALLGVSPKIAYVNEQTFSQSLVDVYAEAGYEAIAMEWNNGALANKNWVADNSYRPQVVKGQSTTLPVLWTDSIAFQFFQRTIHGEKPISDYISAVRSMVARGYQAIPVYTSDIEVINFRPGRFETEATIENDEWQLVAEVTEQLKVDGHIALPSDVIGQFDFNVEPLALTSAKSPIIVKKQRKYSLSRWAACGRGASWINTLCYRYYQELIQQDSHAHEWKTLLTYWGSDFRTHTTEKKWHKAISFLSKFQCPSIVNKPSLKGDKCWQISHENEQIKISYSGTVVVFNPLRGLALDGIYFDDNRVPVGTVKHGELEDIGFGADFYTGTTTIESAETGKVSDLVKVKTYDFGECSDGFMLSAVIPLKDVASIEKVWRYDSATKRLTFSANLKLNKFVRGAIRLGTLTCRPTDKDTPLWYELHQGHHIAERHQLSPQDEIDQHLPQSLIQSCKNGVGATEGSIVIGQGDTRLLDVNIEQSVGMPFIMLQHSIAKHHKLTRIFFSVQELDDTLKPQEQLSHSLQYHINL
ncbi:hypothetical protein ACFSJY_17960 [Thalassotalea euphylliae]|uniref:hypothetical protein n=1 Tax=Thalassotalea euphylliae TaxID=1655234 RepID=UPI003626D394